ncbi:hypothetical protein [Pontixanthobacter sp.]|uniref:hypothetical protein n=1 Tax=Pontixanthobacter sp. TaxID=2792078 RepID=UPI003C7C7779
MTTLKERVESQLDRTVEPAVTAFAKHLTERAGAQAALFYGSNLRTHELEGVLDFYLVMPGPQRDTIWPRVSYHEWVFDGMVLRAKVAALSAGILKQAASGELRDTTIWARFVQPSALVWHRDNASRAHVAESVAQAAITAARFAAALGPESGREGDFWRALFQETYRAELRVEKTGRENSILSLNREHFDGLLPLAWTAGDIDYRLSDERLKPVWTRGQKTRIMRAWRKRRRWGKPLNIIRLLKASTTFDGAARYAAWKIERHTGVPVDITPWRERHPVLAAPIVLWRVWRARQRDAYGQ